MTNTIEITLAIMRQFEVSVLTQSKREFIYICAVNDLACFS